MSDILDTIDASLEEVEEQLLSEFKRLRNEVAPGGDGAVDAGIKAALQELTGDLHGQLENSGDRNNLSLVTERHEIMYSRIAVLASLLKIYKFPLSYLEEAHDGVKERRRRLESAVKLQRANEGKSGEGIRGAFDHKPSDQRIARNEFEVTREEEIALDPSSSVYMDSGIYSASRELAMLASLIKGGTLDRPPAEMQDDPRGRAVFAARDLSTQAPQMIERPKVAGGAPRKPQATEKRDIAQTPEEIRRKLAARREQMAASGKATFASKDINPVVEPEVRRRPEPPPPPPPPPTGKAVFASKDIEPIAPQEFRARPAKKEDEPAPAPARPSGKAIFASKDIEPQFPSDPPRKREKEADEKKEPEKPAGRAVFESRDLSNSPFKKD